VRRVAILPVIAVIRRCLKMLKYLLKRCDEYVCLSVRLSTRISQKPHDRTSQNFLCTLTVAKARLPHDGVAIRYVLPVFTHVMTRLMCIYKRRRDTETSEN